ncbi:thiol-disulfide oxidoreductase DCC family protein [Rhodanobacter sp. 7MK24]|uniref:thiol-disulfide oxidoreductase DCC family protein n=1 Tax=Rhodanobacter sp. 7MK24 TaxID=2775922 RepID=UPI00177E6E19|nr:thiol-disulfide oxidoreductase DCC family protein [Rhodanobacter sp. 7MK24]MBD8879940.1 thiol-disulfide oxidoreductase DCC family protein [Rhodanobacter sp. 7MK24]
MSPEAAPPPEHPVIVFDGVCVLCGRWVDFILRHDRAGRFRLAAMQGQQGRALLIAHGLSPDDPVSFLLVDQGQGYSDTNAIARVLGQLGMPWRAAGTTLRLIPRFLRDPAYRWIARHRYRLFGRRAHCRLPEPDQAWRFID